jgi:hypothetical protein
VALLIKVAEFHREHGDLEEFARIVSIAEIYTSNADERRPQPLLPAVSTSSEDWRPLQIPDSANSQDVAAASASVSQALERLFLRLGPPPATAHAGIEPTRGGDGGVA